MVQTFDPNNVVTYTKAGFPEGTQLEIIEDLIQSSSVLSMGKFIDMGKQLNKNFSFLTGIDGAYWVSETQKIPTSKAQFLQAKLTARKIGLIIPVSDEELTLGKSDFFEAVKPKIVEAFNKKIDQAVITGKNNPFAKSIGTSAKNSGLNKTGEIDYDTILGMEESLNDKGIQGNGFISTVVNNSELRKANQVNSNGIIMDSLFNRSTGTIDGLPVSNTQPGVLTKEQLVFGNFDYLYYGIPVDMEYKISDSAQLSTMVNEDGTPVNLFEQDMMAMRVTMHVAVLPVRDDAFTTLNIADSSASDGNVPGEATNSNDPEAVANTHKPTPPAEGGEEKTKQNSKSSK